MDSSSVATKIHDENWEAQKENIVKAYLEKELSEVINHMEVEHGFSATFVFTLSVFGLRIC